MGSLTLTTMQARLRERIGNPTTTDVPDATLTLRINEAYYDIIDRYRFFGPQALNTVALGANATNFTVSSLLPTGYLIGVSVETPVTLNFTPLTRRDTDWWDSDLRPPPSTRGKPTDYLHYGNTVYVSPKTDASYNIQVRSILFPVELSSGSDIPQIPDSWHRGIVLLARYKHWETVGNMPMAQGAFQIWSTWIQTKADESDEEKKSDWDMKAVIPTLTIPTAKSNFDTSL